MTLSIHITTRDKEHCSILHSPKLADYLSVKCVGAGLRTAITLHWRKADAKLLEYHLHVKKSHGKRLGKLSF